MILGLLSALLLACRPAEVHPIPGSAFRIEPVPSTSKVQTDLSVYPFLEDGACRNALGAEREAEVGLCTPFADRSEGLVRLAFQPRIGEARFPMLLNHDSISVTHDRHPRQDFELIPHDPVPTDQLFILLLDATYSMGLIDHGDQVSRLGKVHLALETPAVLNAFFPPGLKTAVVPLMLRGGPNPIPLSPKVITRDKKEFVDALDNLQAPTGFTPLYKAISNIFTGTMAHPDVESFLKSGTIQPTVIVLTDGFNDDAAPDKCKDNVDKINVLLAQLRELRKKATARDRPSVWTIGLGRAAWPTNYRRPLGNGPISVGDLCGTAGNAERVINADLENFGVDNRGLTLIAVDGGGDAIITQSKAQVAKAFEDAAARRYAWFELRYKIDPFYLRRAWTTRITIESAGSPQAEVRFIPNPWLDTPPATIDAKGQASIAPFSRTLGVVLPLLGAFISLSYLPAAMFNVRRAIFGLVPRRRKKG